TASEIAQCLVGSGFRTKGVDRAVRALAALPPERRRETRLVVIGDGRAGPYRRLAARLGVADRVLIRPGRGDVMACYAAADLLLHPARRENTGGVILEAMIAGLPVLCTGACGFAVHVERAGAGIVLPEPFAQDRLDAALAAMLSPERRAAWSRSALRYAETTDLHGGQEAAARLIEALVREKRAQPAADRT
ncbi:MAG: glycosyltransferase family 4 protein, partial [Rhodospirillaceae bacterium]|nr:glycosyltransferase family 4 protein [Rhodospirillaceae bacterium]